MPTPVSQHARASHWTAAFVIPPDLLAAVPSVSSPLVRLPSELLLHLFSHTIDPLDQLCLALTCRRLLQVSSCLSMKIPSVAKHRYLSWRSCGRILPLLRRLAPVDTRGRPSRTLALCCDCLWYRPTRKSYWIKDGNRYVLMEPGRFAQEFWDDKVSIWTSRFSFQCPACWLKERMVILEQAGKLQQPLS